MLADLMIEISEENLQKAKNYSLEEFERFDWFTRLEPREQEMARVLLQRFADRYTGWIINKSRHEKKKADDAAKGVVEVPPGRLHEEVVQPSTIGYADKSKVLAGFAENFRAAFGREFKKEA